MQSADTAAANDILAHLKALEDLAEKDASWKWDKGWCDTKDTFLNILRVAKEFYEQSQTKSYSSEIPDYSKHYIREAVKRFEDNLH